MRLEFSPQIFEKYSNIEYCVNNFSDSGVFPRGRTDVSKLTVDFRSFMDAPKTFKYEELSNYARDISFSAFRYNLCVTHETVVRETWVRAA